MPAWSPKGDIAVIVGTDGDSCGSIEVQIAAILTEIGLGNIEKVWLPRPGDVVILDNVGFHKNERTAQLVRQRGAWLLFLPPYSPDLNPCMDGSCGSRVSDRIW